MPGRKRPTPNTTPKQKIPTPIATFDGPWKHIVPALFPQFVLFFAPELHTLIDWTHAPIFLDKELRRISYRIKGRRHTTADFLVQVRMRDGSERRLILHIELQAQKQGHFPKRMFLYSTRAFDRYDCPIISIAVLADEDPNWRPNSFVYGDPDLPSTFNFRMVKLLDWADRQQELAESDNAFSLAVLAHLMTQQTAGDAERRLEWKRRLLRILLGRSWERAAIEDLFVFLDMIMSLPEDLEQEFEQEYFEMERTMDLMEKTSPLLKRVEARTEARVQRANILRLGRQRLSEPSEAFAARLNTIDDLDRLNEILDRVLVADSWDGLLDR